MSDGVSALNFKESQIDGFPGESIGELNTNAISTRDPNTLYRSNTEGEDVLGPNADMLGQNKGS